MLKKISVIVPVYNSEKFLERCILSIINQTMQDIEIILINDGSIDDSKKIIDFYQEKYPDIIKSKTIKNSGASNARNVGLEMAEGEYIGFVDSDDYIENTMYEKLYNKAKEQQSDIVVCGYFTEREHNIVSYQIGYTDQYNRNIKENPNIFIYGVPYLWNKIFKRELVDSNHVRFSNLRIFEDLEFVYKLYIHANKIAKVNEPLYYYIKENEKSLTSKFSEKFFDIIPAIKQLKEYYQINYCYDELKDYLTYIALNHIYIRCNMKVSIKELKIKLKYINEIFKFLDKEFPDWKKHDYYFKNTKRNKKKYISKNYWKLITCMQAINFDRLYKLITKVIKKIIKYNRCGEVYIKYYHKLPIDEKLILIDSQHGNDINGNMFYLLKELNNYEEYKNYSIYLGVDKKRISEFETKLNFYKLNNVKLIVNGTKHYMKLLASAKFLFTDTSFIPNYVKKEGQVYLNTWHGTPLKTLGRSTKNDFASIANLQKNFIIADYLLYPSEYMMEHMLEDYMIDTIAKNKILLCGYPRNSVFLDEERRVTVRKELELEGKELIAYMPTWRGTLTDKDTEQYIDNLKEYLEYLSKNLKEDQLLYVNVHPYVKDYIQFENYTNILAFPKQYETYDFLNICDILITDYSSVFFDFALTRKKIILFTYDEQRYLQERGLYISLDSLPFPKIHKIEELLKEIDNKKEINYDEFLEKFCKYDRKDVSKQICQKIILNKENSLKEIEMPKNDKENVLILVRNFSDKHINYKFLKLLENMEEYKYNYYIGYISKGVRKYSYNLLKLPKEIRYMGQLFSMCNVSLFTKIFFKLANKFHIKLNINSKKYKNIFKDELKRIYNDIDFKKVLVFGEKNDIIIQLFSQYDKAIKILYTENDNVNKYKQNFDYVLSNDELNQMRNLNDIIKLGE